MSSDFPLPPNPEEAISPEPLGPPAEVIPEVQPLRRRGHPLVAWFVILTITGLIVAAGMVRDPGTRVGGSRQGTQARLVDVEARYLVGANELTRLTGQDIYEQAKDMVRSSADKRLRFVALAGELRGPDEALRLLNQEAWTDLPAELAALPDLLRRLYRAQAAGDFSSAVLGEQEQAVLERDLGWLGTLALHPAGSPDAAARAALLSSARRTFWAAILVMVLGMAGAGLIGLAGLLIFVGLIRSGAVRSGLGGPGVNGGLYAETFALWLAVFVLQGLFVGLLPVPAAARFLALAGASLASLVTLGWPVLRGVPWRQVRQEVGLRWPDRPLRELALGFACYTSTLPLLVLGVLLTLLLVQLQGYFSGGDAPPPAHPIAEVLAKAAWWELLQLLVLVSVIAPVVEETMFRGVLYRHLRDATGACRPALGILFAMTVVSFIFAVIHPQGLTAVPALMALAYGFNAAREWRGTLLPAMVAHGLNNGIVFLLAILMLSD